MRDCGQTYRRHSWLARGTNQEVWSPTDKCPALPQELVSALPSSGEESLAKSVPLWETPSPGAGVRPLGAGTVPTYPYAQEGLPLGPGLCIYEVGIIAPILPGPVRIQMRHSAGHSPFSARPPLLRARLTHGLSGQWLRQHLLGKQCHMPHYPRSCIPFS